MPLNGREDGRKQRKRSMWRKRNEQKNHQQALPIFPPERPGEKLEGRQGNPFRVQVIDALHPRFVFLENSPRIRTRGRTTILRELVSRGYAWRDGTLAASDVGAWHERTRWWCLAANADGLRQLEQERSQPHLRGWPDHRLEAPAHPDRQGRPHGSRLPADAGPRPQSGGAAAVDPWQSHPSRAATWFEAEPPVGRLVHGMAPDVVQGAVKALGNGQVPLQAALAWLLLGGPL
ncbi:DNA cytosine methyltransferase [Endothiovibrio diazotrophicus]